MAQTSGRTYQLSMYCVHPKMCQKNFTSTAYVECYELSCWPAVAVIISMCKPRSADPAGMDSGPRPDMNGKE